ncbi:tRNA lysidine(34) synthetase TilS [Fervidibacillus halotolerans]|uniref:tRNA(Ile)-lysidine synthase n=1 Tax=Fervidibacillus halotolerans TaxID=2980027 RepID=A0A9E8M126_9BACI|nr:tRNA lysidine(34) synthetase TilS [Fervidibacillus halotolerans]WAA12354.1 tRNA lysidine(34) synthetase TilS [Fervidibacillus halotolerans]
MGSFANKVKNFIEQNELLSEHDKILIGVSGGPDSLALLHFFVSLREEMNLHITACHVDHMFRGEQSFSEMKYVKRICSEWNVPFIGKRINVPEEMKIRGGNPQSIARHLRYRFYEEIMTELNIPLLALGHHGDDQMETILMRLTRGTSVGASGGMRVKRSFANGWIIRPFLCLTRSEIELYIEQNRLKPVFDPSNKKDVYTRNRFRKHILPFLKEENPNVHLHFQQYSEDVHDDDDYLSQLAEKASSSIMKRETDRVSFTVSAFLQLPSPLQRRCLFQTISSFHLDGQSTNLSSSHIRKAIEMIKGKGATRKIDLPGHVQIIRSYDSCIITLRRERTGYSYFLEIGDTVTLPTGGYFSMKEGICKREDRTKFLLPHNTKFPLQIRTRKEGDRIRLKGNGGTKKLKSLFIDEKIPSFLRDEWPIVTDADGEILWVPLLRKSKFEAPVDGKYFILQYKP